MGIYQPDVRLTEQDKRLIVLLAGLLTQSASGGEGNLPDTRAVINDSECAQLVQLLEEFVESKKFIESAYFVENITLGSARPNEQLREIYLSWRSRYGRRRALSSAHWQEFLNRLGVEARYGGYQAASTEIRARMMPIPYFVRMEQMLLENSAVDPRVRRLIMAVLTKHLDAVDAARKGENPLAARSVSKVPIGLLNFLRQDRGAALKMGSVSIARIASVMALVADTSVMFTTRDWGVTGTLSSIASSLAFSVADE